MTYNYCMKIIIYTTALITTMAFVSGWFFALLHLPGASELAILGFLGFAFIFLPWATYDYFSVTRPLSDKLKFMSGFGSAFVVALSVVFKLMQLQGAQALLVIGAALLIFGFLPLLFISIYRKSMRS